MRWRCLNSLHRLLDQDISTAMHCFPGSTAEPCDFNRPTYVELRGPGGNGRPVSGPAPPGLPRDSSHEAPRAGGNIEDKEVISFGRKVEGSLLGACIENGVWSLSGKR